jgi:4'-phosphopantetheinyl transferase
MSPDQHWGPPPNAPVLSDADVHVWAAPLDLPAAQTHALASLLAPDEQTRAARFHFAKDRDHFTASRGLLRTMLGRYLRIDPRLVQFSYGSHGKPTLGGPHASAPLRFNVSHTKGMALFAFTRTRELGVDLEQIRPIDEAEQIAERFFSAQENSVFRRLDRSVLEVAFFNCWTRKEAYIKARGEGLSLPLDQFDVTLAPGDPALLLATRPDPEEARRWKLWSLEPAPGYVGALCVEGHDWQPTYWRWPS